MFKTSLRAQDSFELCNICVLTKPPESVFCSCSVACCSSTADVLDIDVYQLSRYKKRHAVYVIKHAALIVCCTKALKFIFAVLHFQHNMALITRDSLTVS